MTIDEPRGSTESRGFSRSGADSDAPDVPPTGLVRGRVLRWTLATWVASAAASWLIGGSWSWLGYLVLVAAVLILVLGAGLLRCSVRGGMVVGLLGYAAAGGIAMGQAPLRAVLTGGGGPVAVVALVFLAAWPLLVLVVAGHAWRYHRARALDRYRAGAEQPLFTVPTAAEVALQAGGLCLMVWACAGGAGWLLGIQERSGWGYLLLVLAILLMGIGPGSLRAPLGVAAGLVLFMILGWIVLAWNNPVQRAWLDARGQPVAAVVAAPVRGHAVGSGPWLCETTNMIDGQQSLAVNHLDVPASSGIHGCVTFYGFPQPCARSSCPPFVAPPGERIQVLTDPHHLVAPAARYQAAAALGTGDYLGIAFVVLFPVLVFGLSARGYRGRVAKTSERPRSS